MKLRFLLIFLSFISFINVIASNIEKTTYFENNLTLGGDVKILSSKKFVIGEKSYTQFDVDAPNSGKYFINFWMLPSKSQDGSFCSYQVEVNSVPQSTKITPFKSDWQSITLDSNSTVFLNSGINTITIVGTVPEVPAVEHIRLSKTIENSLINSDIYDSYKSFVDVESQKENTIKTAGTGGKDPWTDPIEGTASYKMFGYTSLINETIRYTFHNTVAYNSGDSILVESTGIDGFAHVVNVFKVDDPEKYSWVSNASRGNGSIRQLIQEGGLYQIVLQSYRSGDVGKCDVRINNNRYESTLVSGTRIVYALPTGIECNSFTSNSSVDPILWVGELSKGKVMAYNDDYVGDGVFDWGYNSRIRKTFSKPARSATVAVNSSYNPIGVCDIYIGCLKGNVDKHAFPTFREDDAIQSALPTGNKDIDVSYNCIGWAGGLSSWEEPPYMGTSEKDDLDWYDNYFGNERYPGSPIYTRDGANAENGIVALWATMTTNGSISIGCYQHASVKKGGDERPHGYDWESKLGSGPRIFHPRYALTGANSGEHGYGKIVRYYRLADNNANINTLEEAIADGSAVIENLRLNEAESQFIDNKVSMIKSSQLEEFESLYNAWSNIWNNSIYSLSSKIADCREYRDLLSYCHDNNLIYLAFKAFAKGDLCAMRLVFDISNPNKEASFKSIQAYNDSHKYDANGAMIIRSTPTVVMAYIKQIIQLEIDNNTRRNVPFSDATYSNSDGVNVTSSYRVINTEIDIDSPSIISIEILNKNGDIRYCCQNNDKFDTGRHNFKTEINTPGIYFVKVLINGRWNVKKVIIK